MANIPVFDPKDSEVVSPLIAGLTEGLNRLSEALNLNTSENTNVQLDTLIWTDDKGNSVVGKMYQAPFGKKLWLQNPAPIIKKNGNIIKPQTDHFTIDYIGGGLFFEDDYVLQASDIVTADFTQVKAESAVIYSILQDISDLQTKAAHDKGWFSTYDDLISSYPTGVDGDHVIIGETDTVWVWDNETDSWKDSHKGVDLSNYYTISQVDNLLSQKEPTIAKRGESISDDNYYFGGRKQWVDLYYKIRNTVLTGFSASTTGTVSATDTLISALGKLQNQLNTNANQIQSINNTISNIKFKTGTFAIANSSSSGGIYYSGIISIPNTNANTSFDIVFQSDLYNALKTNGNSWIAIQNNNGTVKAISDKSIPTVNVTLRWAVVSRADA